MGDNNMANIDVSADSLNNATNMMASFDDFLHNKFNEKYNSLRKQIPELAEPVVVSQPQFFSDGLPQTMSSYDVGQEQISNNNILASLPPAPLPTQTPKLDKFEQGFLDFQKQLRAEQQAQPITQAQTQAKTQQAMPTQPQIKQAIAEKKRELSLLELFGKGMADALKDPVTSTGKTNTLYDMLRGAMAVQAPQQSAIMEQEIKGLQDTETARVKAEVELAKEQRDLIGKLAIEGVKADVNRLKEAGKIEEKQGSLLIQRMDKLDGNSAFGAIREGLLEIDATRIYTESGSSYSYPSLINTLIRLSGDKRINEYDRQAFNAALGLKEGMEQNIKLKILGGKLTKGTEKEAQKVIDSAVRILSERAHRFIDAEKETLLLSKQLEPADVEQLIINMKSKYGLIPSQPSQPTIGKEALETKLGRKLTEAELADAKQRGLI